MDAAKLVFYSLLVLGLFAVVHTFGTFLGVVWLVALGLTAGAANDT